MGSNISNQLLLAGKASSGLSSSQVGGLPRKASNMMIGKNSRVGSLAVLEMKDHSLVNPQENAVYSACGWVEVTFAKASILFHPFNHFG